MLHVTILMVGKTRKAFIQEGPAFYQKRLEPFLQLTLKSVREEKEEGRPADGVRIASGKSRFLLLEKN
jgi:23S rRNA pseudoU1915 N3-methylase RlmH